ncbi:uncharacterized protein [Vicugna pacos]|uniref:Uncharacterized protein n=1 Tax=Vicugna pacos TaxID=30538 RepID=A0ABM5D799_VICPA
MNGEVRRPGLEQGLRPLPRPLPTLPTGVGEVALQVLVCGEGRGSPEAPALCCSGSRMQCGGPQRLCTLPAAILDRGVASAQAAPLAPRRPRVRCLAQPFCGSSAARKEVPGVRALHRAPHEQMKQGEAQRKTKTKQSISGASLLADAAEDQMTDLEITAAATPAEALLALVITNICLLHPSNSMPQVFYIDKCSEDELCLERDGFELDLVYISALTTGNLLGLANRGCWKDTVRPGQDEGLSFLLLVHSFLQEPGDSLAPEPIPGWLLTVLPGWLPIKLLQSDLERLPGCARFPAFSIRVPRRG